VKGSEKRVGFVCLLKFLGVKDSKSAGKSREKQHILNASG
jgi:hypothetical protein